MDIAAFLSVFTSDQLCSASYFNFLAPPKAYLEQVPECKTAGDLAVGVEEERHSPDPGADSPEESGGASRIGDRLAPAGATWTIPTGPRSLSWP